MNVTFWFEFASTYSYLSVMRLPSVAEERGIEVTWRPFLLGPVFAAQGMQDSPFNIYPVKGAYMWRDMARRAESLRLSFRKPDPFPQNGLFAARVATAAADHHAMIPFVQAVYTAQFADGLAISELEVIARCAEMAGLPPEILEMAQSRNVKDRLRAATEEAQVKGVFGAPSFTVGDELFWGDDRLEDALDWAANHG